MRHIATTILTFLYVILVSGCGATKSQRMPDHRRAIIQDDYDQIKALAGDWYLVRGVRLGVELESNFDEPFMSYAVSSGGHSVIERLFVDKPNEMTSVYYLNAGQLYMDHYCSLGNQPRMVAAPTTLDEIPFKLLSVTNMAGENDLHISSHSIEFDGPDEITVRWGATKDQEPTGGSFYTVKRDVTP